MPTNMDTAVSNFDGLCLAFVSVEPYREMCNLNLLLESQGEKKETEHRAGPSFFGFLDALVGNH